MKDDLIYVLQEINDSDWGKKWNKYISLNSRPIYDVIRSDPRFQKILAQRKEQYEENLRKYGDIEDLFN